MQLYLQDLQSYEEEVEAYNEEVDDYNNLQPIPPEYNSRHEWYQGLLAWSTDLDNWYEELQLEAETLGVDGQYWDPTGSLAGVSDPTVVRFYVHW